MRSKQPVLRSTTQGSAGRSPGKRQRLSIDRKSPSNAIDLGTLLQFSQQLYAHALTLQEVVRSQGQLTYEKLRPRFDRQAAQQFEIFYRTFQRPDPIPDKRTSLPLRVGPA
jgi:hypothetical protein